MTNERLDLLAVAEDGQLVVIELKRDDSGVDAHWQAIKYTSYLYNVDKSEIVEMTASYMGKEKNEARQELMIHTNTDEDLEDLNENQRIILVSHRFAPAVTSAAIWLNEQASRDLVTCVQLTPYKDSTSGDLYLLANTIIPVSGAERYYVGLRHPSEDGPNLTNRFGFRQNDEVTQFCKKVGSKILEELPPEVRPTRKSRWAGLNTNNRRYYHMWYRNEEPWANWNTSYRILLDSEITKGEEGLWNAEIGLAHKPVLDELEQRLSSVQISSDLETDKGWIFVRRSSANLDEPFCKELAEALIHFISHATPVIRDLINEEGE